MGATIGNMTSAMSPIAQAAVQPAPTTSITNPQSGPTPDPSMGTYGKGGMPPTTIADVFGTTGQAGMAADTGNNTVPGEGGMWGMGTPSPSAGAYGKGGSMPAQSPLLQKPAFQSQPYPTLPGYSDPGRAFVDAGVAAGDPMSVLANAAMRQQGGTISRPVRPNGVGQAFVDAGVKAGDPMSVLANAAMRQQARPAPRTALPTQNPLIQRPAFQNRGRGGRVV